jgi:hypothetical protein
LRADSHWSPAPAVRRYHHKAARQRGGVNPAVGGDFDLQSFLLILQQEAEETGVLMRANALGALGFLLAGIAD